MDTFINLRTKNYRTQFAETYQGHVSKCKKPHSRDETYLHLPRPRIYQPSDVPSTWRNALTIYTKSALTREDDKLIAIQGLIKEFAPLVHDESIAGLWQDIFSDELLWEVEDGTHVNGEPVFRPQTY